jgi:hypothetical protein
MDASRFRGARLSRSFALPDGARGDVDPPSLFLL